MQWRTVSTMPRLDIATMDSPLGALCIQFDTFGVWSVTPSEAMPSVPKTTSALPPTWQTGIKLATTCLGTAAIPICTCASDFQRAVWQALQTTVAGQTLSYSDIAHQLGKPRATRAVASAIAKNPLAFIVPCHRVVLKSGQLGQFRWGADLKQRWQTYEQQLITQDAYDHLG